MKIPNMLEVKKAIAKMLNETVGCDTDGNCQCEGPKGPYPLPEDDYPGCCANCSTCCANTHSTKDPTKMPMALDVRPTTLTEVKRAIAKMIKEQGENGELSKDAQKIADSSLMVGINNVDDWVDMMNLLFDHGSTISTVTNGIKKTTLQALIKRIGEEDTPENEAL